MSNYNRERIDNNTRELEELVAGLESFSVSSFATAPNVQMQRSAYSLYIEDEPLVISGNSENEPSNS